MKALIQALSSLYKGLSKAPIKALSRLYTGSMKALLRLYLASIKALLSLCYGSIKALLRVSIPGGLCVAQHPLSSASSRALAGALLRAPPSSFPI